MNYREIFEGVKELDDKYTVCCHARDDNESVELFYEMTDDLKKICIRKIRDKRTSDEKRNEAFEMYQKCFKLLAPYRFEDFMIYLEIHRPLSEQFYRPRMKILHEVCVHLQMLHDGELDELMLSCPPRIGKTTIVSMFLLWCMGKNSEKTNLYSSHSDTLVHAFYEGIRELISDDMTYAFKEIFPDTKVVTTNSKMNVLDLDRQKKYPTLTCRSISGTLNGSCDCNGLLIADDLCGGIEEALNPERMTKLWKTVDNNLLTRAKEQCRILWIGTRWSIKDPIGLRIDTIENDRTFSDRKYKVINLPALDDNDESNFQYDYGVGFSTKYYHQRRASFDRNNDLASWSAQFMCEPIEREGVLFDAENMKYFNGVMPEEGLERVVAVVDHAWGGGDFVAMPIAYVYETGEVYIVDVLYDNGDKSVTMPKVASKLKYWGVSECEVERNNGGDAYKDGVIREMEKIDYSCVMTSKSATQSSVKGTRGTTKDMRIFNHAPEIRGFYFLENGKRTGDYSRFMMNVFSFKVLSKNKNDDAPDSLAQLCEKLYKRVTVVPITVFNRPF